MSRRDNRRDRHCPPPYSPGQLFGLRVKRTDGYGGSIFFLEPDTPTPCTVHRAYVGDPDVLVYVRQDRLWWTKYVCIWRGREISVHWSNVRPLP